jgi:transcriptional regulator with XRE-family HTH domain
MIGLEYILKLFEITQQYLADKLEIKRQNIDSWIRGKRNIPKKYLPTLSEIFNIPVEYLQKEIDDIDKLRLQKIKLMNDCNKLGLKLEEI